MRKVIILAVAACLLVNFSGKAATCPKTLAKCPEEGCAPSGDFDPNLNRAKNMQPGDPGTTDAAEPMTLQAIKKLHNPKHFVKGGSRDELAELGEGKKVRMTAFLLTAKREGGESCNCKLTDDAEEDKDIGVNTDNHLVLVSSTTVKKFPMPPKVDVKRWKKITDKRERESITAEFTPRVRLTHPNFTRAATRQLILNARQMALPVRVTGMLMFDSEHFRKKALVRVTNWEIHPVLELEFCPKGETCTADSDTGWQSLDEEDETAP
jgi:hypothetical protein